MNFKFKNNGIVYIAELFTGRFSTGPGIKKGMFMFGITLEDGRHVGCVVFNTSLLGDHAWNQEGLYKDFTEEQKILFCLSLLNHLPFYPEKLMEIYGAGGGSCFEYFFTTGYEEQETGNYNINAEGGYIKTAQKIIYGSEITNGKICRKILDVLYSHWEDYPDTGMTIQQILAFVLVEPTPLKRNLRRLAEDGKIYLLTSSADPSMIISGKILSPGLREVEGEIVSNGTSSVEYVQEKIMGNKISASTSGSNSPIIIDSQVTAFFGELLLDLEKSDTQNKEEVAADVKELEKQIKGDKDPSKIRGLMEKIGTSAGWINQKVISHPVVAQILAQVLVQSWGITTPPQPKS